MGSLPLNEGEVRPARRIAALKVIAVCVIAGYALILFKTQILSGQLYKDRAERITQRASTIPAQRGEIYDRTMNVPMVLNIDSFAVEVVPAEIPSDKRTTVLTTLAGLLGKKLSEVEQAVPLRYQHLYQSIEVATNVPYETIARIAERIDELPGVGWHSKPIRNYLETGSLSHVIGYVGDITREELKVLYNKGYQSGALIGKTGIEKQYDELLRGKDGQRIRTVDVRGKRVADDSGVIDDPPVMGKNLVLTIDRSIQTLAEKALGERMGGVVVMKPTTGEVLAMVSYPWYDPNIFNQANSGNLYQALIQDQRKPFLNRTIQSNYPPASTFKIVMTAGILAENAFPPDKLIDCDGEIEYGDRVFRCWIRKPGHGPLDLRGGMAQSCDVYFWQVGRDYLGIERIVSYAKEFGFGSPTGIDLPGEISGFVPTPQWKERRFHEKWLGGDTMNMSIGQGYTLVTPIQMANMVSMVVNDGTVYRPHLLKEIRDPVSGAIISESKPEVLIRSNIKPEVFATTRDNMRAVVSEGTARFPLNIKSVQIAGKTGTGEVGLADHWHSWFAAFAPYETDDPDERIVVSIIVEASNTWEWWAPYASAIIFQGIFADQSYDEAVQALGLQYLMVNHQRERRD